MNIDRQIMSAARALEDDDGPTRFSLPQELHPIQSSALRTRCMRCSSPEPTR